MPRDAQAGTPTRHDREHDHDHDPERDPKPVDFRPEIEETQGVLRANQAVRLGFRAASRNPELAFGKALLDLARAALPVLPLAFSGVLVAGEIGQQGMVATLHALPRIFGALRWPTLGAVLAAAAAGWAASMLFWAGALPLLAADAELGRRPPAGLFARLASRGFARVAGTGALAAGLLAVFAATVAAGFVAAAIAFSRQPSGLRAFGVALLVALAVASFIVLDLLAQLMLVRSAALGDGVTKAAAKAMELLLRRLGGCVVVAAVFFSLRLIVGWAAALLLGASLDGLGSPAQGAEPGVRLLLAVPRVLAVGLAFAPVFAWLDVSRGGALASLAADAEGLIEPPQAPPSLAETVVEAVLAEPVVEALPAADDSQNKGMS